MRAPLGTSSPACSRAGRRRERDTRARDDLQVGAVSQVDGPPGAAGRSDHLHLTAVPLPGPRRPASLATLHARKDQASGGGGRSTARLPTATTGPIAPSSLAHQHAGSTHEDAGDASAPRGTRTRARFTTASFGLVTASDEHSDLPRARPSSAACRDHALAARSLGPSATKSRGAQAVRSRAIGTGRLRPGSAHPGRRGLDRRRRRQHAAAGGRYR